MLFDRWRFVLKLSIVWRGRYEQSKSVSSGGVRIKFWGEVDLVEEDFWVWWGIRSLYWTPGGAKGAGSREPGRASGTRFAHVRLRAQDAHALSASVLYAFAYRVPVSRVSAPVCVGSRACGNCRNFVVSGISAGREFFAGHGMAWE